METATSEQLAECFKALAHPVRLRIVELLASEGQRCLCDLAPAVALHPATVSRHLSLLKRAGLVVARREGASVWCSARGPCARKLIEAARAVVACCEQAASQAARGPTQ